jgi:hypothetical protein
LYLLNPTSLAKPHALQQLHGDLLVNNIDVCIISETWFKSRHSDQSVTMAGYNLFRLDRNKRRAGGVAIYIRDTVASKRFHPINQDSRFEIV